MLNKHANNISTVINFKVSGPLEGVFDQRALLE